MDLEEFISRCETRAVEDDHEDYIEKAICNLSRDDCEKIMGYVSSLMQDNNKKYINSLLEQASVKREMLVRGVSDFRKIAVGCLTTIGEKEHGSSLQNPYIVPEMIDFTGILAGSEKERSYFRFVKPDKKLGRPGFNAGKYAINVHIGSL